MISLSSLNDDFGSAQQDDWINVLTGMDSFLESEEIVDALNLGSPLLPPVNVDGAPALNGLSSFSLPANIISTVNVVENPTSSHENKPSNVEPGKASAELQRPSCTPSSSNVFEVEKNVTKRSKPVVTSSSNNKNAISAAAKAQARSERKRSREKQRRIDVNSQIVELTTLLLKIETDERNEDLGIDESAPSISKRSKSINIPSNRVDLISRTIALLTRLHNENKKRNRDVVELREKLSDVKELHQAAQRDASAKAQQMAQHTQHQQNFNTSPKPVIMMMPMMLPANGVNGGQQAICMPQAMQLPLQMQMQAQQMFSSTPQSACTVQNTIHTQDATPVVTSYPPVVQASSQPVLQQQIFCYPPPSNVSKPVKNQSEKDQSQSFNTVAFDSSQINMSSGGNLAHCA